MQQSLEVRLIKTEAKYTDEELSLYNIKMENVKIVKGLKKEGTVVSERASTLDENLPIKIEDTEEAPKHDFIGHGTENLLEIPENVVTILKYEMKTEEIDDSCSSAYFQDDILLKGSNLSHTVAATEDPSTNWCGSDLKENIKIKQPNCNPIREESDKLWQKIEMNDLCTGPSNFKSDLTQQRNSFTCFHCNYSSNSKAKLVRHMLVHDKRNKKLFFCTSCEYSTKYKHNIVRHIRIHSNLKSDMTQQRSTFFCFHCEYSSNSKMNLVRHMLVHDKRNKKLFFCTSCEYSTKYKQNFNRHTRIHSGNYEKQPVCKIHSCTYCEKHFKHKRCLDDHIIKNHKNFIDSNTIKVHVGNYEKHSCTSCEKHFKEKRSLDDHIIKNHQNLIDLVSNKIHSCPTCDYKTTSKSHLRTHKMKVHSENYKKHSCTCCKKHFKDKRTLDDHIVKNHQNLIDFVSSKIHNCPACDYKTVNITHLRRHTRNVHCDN